MAATFSRGEQGAVEAVLSRWSSQMHVHPAAPATSNESPSLLFVEEAERKGDRNGESLMINITAELSLTCSRTHTCLSSGHSFIKF